MNEKKLGAIIVLIVALIAPVMILAGYVEYALTPPWHPHHHSSELTIQDNCINENVSSLNVSLTIQSYTNKAIPVNAIELGKVAKTSSLGVIVYVNGTNVDCAVSPLFMIQPSDTAVVNMVVPYVSNPYALATLHSAESVSLTVLTDEAMYGVYRDTSGL